MKRGPFFVLFGALRTHILRLLGPKTILYKALLGYFDAQGKGTRNEQGQKGTSQKPRVCSYCIVNPRKLEH